MADEVYPGILRIELPLPRNPLKAVNSYVIMGDDRNLIVDTGMNRPECREVLDRELGALDIDLSATDIFVTHLHADHLGLAPYLHRGKAKVFMGAPDIEMINESEYWSKMLDYALKNGFPGVDPQQAIRKHPGYRYGPLGPMELTPVHGGDAIRVGDFNFVTIYTPGHSSGHMCLFDEEEKLLLSGDHILSDITPNISLWSDEEDNLTDYIGSLKKVRELEVKVVLPGHRRIISDHRKRIDELLKHHRDRAEEIIEILEGSEMDAFSVASGMTWDMTYDSFDEFPIMQKWFALGEAIAHIRYLESVNRVGRTLVKGKIIYHRV